MTTTDTLVPSGTAARPGRPGWATMAAVILLSVGALSAIFGLFFLVAALAMGSVWGEMMRAQPGMPATVDPDAIGRMMGGMMIGMSVVVLAWAAANVVAGVGILGGRGWARILGMVVASIGAGMSALAMAGMLWSWTLTADMMRDPRFSELYGPFGSSDMIGAGMVMTLLFMLPFVVAYGLVLVGLIGSGRFFAGRSAPPLATA